MSLGTFLNGRPATQLRGLQWLSLSDVGVRFTLTSVSDSGGGATQAWANAGTTDCRIDPLGTPASSGRTGGQIDERSTHMVTVPGGTPVSLTDRFAINGRGTFDVTATRSMTGEAVTLFEVIQIS